MTTGSKNGAGSARKTSAGKANPTSGATGAKDTGRGSGGSGANKDHNGASAHSKAAGGSGARAKGNGPDPAVPDVMAIAAGVLKELSVVGAQLKATFDQVAEEAQYKFDQELAKALAKHPELYAEVRRTIRQIQKTADKAAEAMGFEGDKK